MFEFLKRSQKRDKNYTENWLCSTDAYESLCVGGYTRMADNPEVQMAVNYVADLIGSMTIHLMRNTMDGDVRVKNELARKLDVEPYSLITRKAWISYIVKNMMLEGNQIVVPHTSLGRIIDLVPLPPSTTSFVPSGYGYFVQHQGQMYAPQEILHFALNPDTEQPWLGIGYRAALKDIVHNLRQATATKKGFMESKWKPSMIIKADGLVAEFDSREGRKRLLKEYIDTDNAGEPWVIPAGTIDVAQIKPLSLNDLALNEAVTIDKKTVAGILGVPPYVVGAGPFNSLEHRNFIDTYVMPKARIIEQELTKKLLYSSDHYIRLNPRSLYGYNLKELSEVALAMYVRGLATGNEARDLLGFTPREGLNELVMLENYIPAESIGAQKKLLQESEGEDD